MAQTIFSNIDPATKTGTQLATDLNNFKAALLSGLSGTTKPDEVTAGGTWIDTSTTNKLILKMYDGTDNITILTVDTTTNKVELDTGVPESAERVKYGDAYVKPGRNFNDQDEENNIAVDTFYKEKVFEFLMDSPTNAVNFDISNPQANVRYRVSYFPVGYVNGRFGTFLDRNTQENDFYSNTIGIYGDKTFEFDSCQFLLSLATPNYDGPTDGKYTTRLNRLVEIGIKKVHGTAAELRTALNKAGNGVYIVFDTLKPNTNKYVFFYSFQEAAYAYDSAVTNSPVISVNETLTDGERTGTIQIFFNDPALFPVGLLDPKQGANNGAHPTVTHVEKFKSSTCRVVFTTQGSSLHGSTRDATKFVSGSTTDLNFTPGRGQIRLINTDLDLNGGIIKHEAFKIHTTFPKNPVAGQVIRFDRGQLGARLPDKDIVMSPTYPFQIGHDDNPLRTETRVTPDGSWEGLSYDKRTGRFILLAGGGTSNPTPLSTTEAAKRRGIWIMNKDGTFNKNSGQFRSASPFTLATYYRNHIQPWSYQTTVTNYGYMLSSGVAGGNNIVWFVLADRNANESRTSPGWDVYNTSASHNSNINFNGLNGPPLGGFTLFNLNWAEQDLVAGEVRVIKETQTYVAAVTWPNRSTMHLHIGVPSQMSSGGAGQGWQRYYIFRQSFNMGEFIPEGYKGGLISEGTRPVQSSGTAANLYHYPRGGMFAVQFDHNQNLPLKEDTGLAAENQTTFIYYHDDWMQFAFCWEVWQGYNNQIFIKRRRDLEFYYQQSHDTGYKHKTFGSHAMWGDGKLLYTKGWGSLYETENSVQVNNRKIFCRNMIPPGNYIFRNDYHSPGWVNQATDINYGLRDDDINV